MPIAEGSTRIRDQESLLGDGGQRAGCGGPFPEIDHIDRTPGDHTREPDAESLRPADRLRRGAFTTLCSIQG
jgi:hypothetical protein